jgi:hypothetical protein
MGEAMNATKAKSASLDRAARGVGRRRVCRSFDLEIAYSRFLSQGVSPIFFWEPPKPAKFRQVGGSQESRDSQSLEGRA